MSSDKTMLKKYYDSGFKVTPEYRATLPDMQNQATPENGTAIPILQVGMSNFRLPLRYVRREGENSVLETAVTGTISLDAEHKGINMSRIMRIFYEFKDESFTLDTLAKILKQYVAELGSRRAQLRLDFNYPLLQRSLRSDLCGYQYYACAYEGILENGELTLFVTFDFVYSSACPCSAELAEHARQTRKILGIPHSQRSKARIKAKIVPAAAETLRIEDLQEHCLNALHTETQVMVRREDEQAFAEMNGAYYKFVEDAARLLYTEFDKDERVCDFQIVCAHLESLHSHDAVAVLNKGVPGGFQSGFSDFRSLIC
ncbi:MAG: GTP cyclohydrolase FolE2 [Opitutales bacterium]|nr:GTP cyclohydrolase FolE2 [Opitutales bacterium]